MTWRLLKGYRSNDKNLIRLPWKYLPQPHGRVRDEGLGKKGGTDIGISYRISGYQSGGDRQPSLSSGTAQAGRAWPIFGVVIGLSLFGFMGVIFGPLLLSLFFLFVDMFKREYLDGKK